jgi:hypothetical protein
MTFETSDATTRADGFMLDFKDLVPGDILVFRAIDPAPLTKRIARSTGSPYTHAAVYLGDMKVLEAGDQFVEIRSLDQSDKKDWIVGVFRSQCGFGEDRVRALMEFAETLVGNRLAYDKEGLKAFRGTRTKFEENLLDRLRLDYGKVMTKDELERRPYFCSSLVVAVYIACGIIGDTAQLAYQPDAFSPADLHREPTFGWFLGYVTDSTKAIPAEDPLLTATSWRDASEPQDRWWMGGAAAS